MDMQAVKEEVRLKLTGDVVSLELSDTALTQIINSALREVQRYIDTFKMITVPYTPCIDLSSYKISAVTGVRRAEGYMPNAMSSSGLSDPLYASQWMMLSSIGNVGKISDYASNLAAWNSLMQIRNTMSTDLAFYYDKSDKKLYVNISSGNPQKVTIMYIPRLDDVSEIESDYWNDVLVRLALALAKVTVGRVRTKFKQSNAQWALDGDQILEEGNTELAALRQELNDSTQLVYGVD